MTKDQLQIAKLDFSRADAKAQRVLRGDSEYDGADAAREIADLCSTAYDLIADLEPHCDEGPGTGKESP